MIIAIIIGFITLDAITFILGFLIGFQHGEASIGTRLKYALLTEENTRYKLACLNLKNRLRIKNNDPITEPDYDPDYDYEGIEA